MNCRQYTELASKSLDSPLSLADRFGGRVHSFLCGKCRRFQRQLREIHRTAGSFMADDVPIDIDTPMPPDTRERIRQNLANST